MNTCCVVVIGHVDHGKTAIVRALTGTDTDRLPEEKKRGLSIVPGYAHATYPSGIVDFIDVPGHEDFIQAMVSGASGARAALLVISATEGIRAQTLEHLEIAAALGLEKAIVAVTKSDLLTTVEREHRMAEIRHALSDTDLGDGEMIACSALTGEGLEDVHSLLEAFITRPSHRVAPPHAFLPVDRVFSLAGRGTIVTGTLTGGELASGAQAQLMPPGVPVTLRGLHARGEERDTVQAGERIAVNLRSIAVAQIPRGAVLWSGGDYGLSNCMDVALTLPTRGAHTLKHNEQVRVLLGTASAVAHVRLFRTDAGGTTYAQLRFQKPVVGFAGQRAVLRRLSPQQTIGGAIVLDPQATPARPNDTLRVALLAAVERQDISDVAANLARAQGGAFSLKQMARLLRRSAPNAQIALDQGFVPLGADFVAAREDIADCTLKITAALTNYHTEYPLDVTAKRSVLSGIKANAALVLHAENVLLECGLIRARGTRLALSEHDPVSLLTPDQRTRMAELEAMFFEATLAPPRHQDMEQDALDRDLMALLVDMGRLWALPNIALGQTIVFHRDALDAAAVLLRAEFPPPLSFSTSQARSALLTSRRIIVPVLEYFDTQGITLRTNDLRKMAPDFSVTPQDAT